MCSLAAGKTRICYFQIHNELVSLSILMSLCGIDSYPTAVIISSDVQKESDNVARRTDVRTSLIATIFSCPKTYYLVRAVQITSLSQSLCGLRHELSSLARKL
jgi:hypothetical protein